MKCVRTFAPLATLVLATFSPIADAAVPRTEAGISQEINNNSPVQKLELNDGLSVTLISNDPAGIQQILTKMTNVPGQDYQLIITKQDGTPVTVDFEPAGAVGGTGTGTRTVAGRQNLQSETECRKLWTNNPPTDRRKSGEPEEVYIVFNEHGSLCYQSHIRVTEGDNLRLVAYAGANEIDSLSSNVVTCSLEPSTPVILDSIPDGFTPTAAAVIKRREFPPLQCFDSSVTLSIKKSDGSNFAGPLTINQYQRYRGTWQVGVVWSDLSDEGFSVADLGAGNVIRANSDGSTGPEYLGSLVIYGVPYYLQTLFRKDQSYAGRDVVNENNGKDRLGLAFSIGLQDPKDTLGIGLTFEIVPGLNLTATQLFRRVSKLDTFNVGDPFSGTAEQIPTFKSWEDDTVIGLSVDGRYITKFFTKASQ